MHYEKFYNIRNKKLLSISKSFNCLRKKKTKIKKEIENSHNSFIISSRDSRQGAFMIIILILTKKKHGNIYIIIKLLVSIAHCVCIESIFVAFLYKKQKKIRKQYNIKSIYLSKQKKTVHVTKYIHT